jgi:hypothetical protein
MRKLKIVFDSDAISKMLEHEQTTLDLLEVSEVYWSADGPHFNVVSTETIRTRLWPR